RSIVASSQSVEISRLYRPDSRPRVKSKLWKKLRGSLSSLSQASAVSCCSDIVTPSENVTDSMPEAGASQPSDEYCPPTMRRLSVSEPNVIRRSPGIGSSHGAFLTLS